MPRLVFTNIVGSPLGIANSNTGFAKGFSIPAAGLTKDFTGGDLEELGPQLEAHRTAGRLSWTQDQNPGVADALELLSGAGRASLLATVQTVAKSTTAVHASILGTTSVVPVTTGITNPTVARNLTATMAATWDGGNIAIVGTDQFDVPQTETITGTANSTVVGTKIWKTVTSVAHTVVGAAAVGYSVGTGDKIGVPYKVSGTAGLCLAGISLAASVPEAVTVDPVASGYTATSVPNGSIFFTVIVNTAG